jgi:hypothetical protein
MPTPTTAAKKELYLTRREWALKYAKMGWEVFPIYEVGPTDDYPDQMVCACSEGIHCSNKGKHPRSANGFKDATTDVGQVNQWWELHSTANVGIRCGPGSNLLVMDVDKRNGGEETLIDLVGKYGKPPNMGIVFTGGGYHHLFPWPEDLKAIPRKLGPGIDVQGDNRYIVAAGSRHSSGKHYRWANGSFVADSNDWIKTVIIGEKLDSEAADPGVDPSEFGEPTQDDHEWASRALENARWNIQLRGEGTRNDTLNQEAYSMFGLVARGVLDADEVYKCLLNAAKNADLGESEARSVLDRAKVAGLAKPRSLYSEMAKQSDAGGRPVILVRNEFSEMIDETWASMCKPGCNLYQRLRRVVEIVSEKSGEEMRYSVQPVRTGGFTDKLDRIVQFMKPSQDADGNTIYLKAQPPARVINSLLDRNDFPLPAIDSIIYCPTLRADGSLVNKAGYDSRTGVYLVLDDTKYPDIPDNPTDEQAEAAYEILVAPWCDFPFVQDYHKAAMASAVVALVCRQAIRGPVPLYALIAGSPGTGKTLLADTISMIALGLITPKQPLSTESGGEEIKKMILSQLREGPAMVCLDNIASMIKAPSLDSLLTAWPHYTDRILGESSTATVSTNTMWVASGNNMRFGGDLHRRVIPIVLRTTEENPELRSGFKHNPLLDYIKENRGKLVAAALTLGRYSMQVNSKLVPLGSFEAWSKVARNGIYEISCHDVVAGQQAIREDTQAPLRGMFKALHAVFEDAAFTAKDIMDRVGSYENKNTNVEALRIAFSELGVDHTDAKSLGHFLRSVKDRNVSNLVICQLRRTRKGNTWTVQKITK